jgi:hypothetical protein
MRWIRFFLNFGGIFNGIMGLVFMSQPLLAAFFSFATMIEKKIFLHTTILPLPTNPIHLLLIHGFGAGALILGGTLLVSARDPIRYLPFIFIDALGRLLYGAMMLAFIFRFALMRFLLVFAGIELGLGIVYLIITWKYSE